MANLCLAYGTHPVLTFDPCCCPCLHRELAWAAGWRLSQLPAPYQATGFNATLYRHPVTVVTSGGSSSASSGAYTLQLLGGGTVATRVVLELADGACESSRAVSWRRALGGQVC